MYKNVYQDWQMELWEQSRRFFELTDEILYDMCMYPDPFRWALEDANMFNSSEKLQEEWGHFNMSDEVGVSSPLYERIYGNIREKKDVDEVISLVENALSRIKDYRMTISRNRDNAQFILDSMLPKPLLQDFTNRVAGALNDYTMQVYERSESLVNEAEKLRSFVTKDIEIAGEDKLINYDSKSVSVELDGKEYQVEYSGKGSITSATLIGKKIYLNIAVGELTLEANRTGVLHFDGSDYDGGEEDIEAQSHLVINLNSIQISEVELQIISGRVILREIEEDYFVEMAETANDVEETIELDDHPELSANDFDNDSYEWNNDLKWEEKPWQVLNAQNILSEDTFTVISQ